MKKFTKGDFSRIWYETMFANETPSGQCFICGTKLDPDFFQNTAPERERINSIMCQYCQDIECGE